MGHFTLLWDRLTEPAAAVDELDKRRQARLLAGLLFFMLFFGVINEFIVDPLISPDQRPGTLISSRNITFVLVSLAYIFSRTVYYQFGAVLVVLFFWLGIFAELFYPDSPPDPFMLYYLIVPVIFANMFLPTGYAVLAALVNCVSVLVIPLVSPALTYDTLPILFLYFVSGLLMFAVYHRNSLEQDRRAMLMESEERYRTLLETVFEGIAILDGDVISNVNSGFSKVFGCSTSEAMGQPLSRFIPEWDRLKAVDSTSSEPFYTRGIARTGTPLHLEIVMKMFTRHQPMMRMVAVRDITERKRAEEALQQAQRLDSIGMLAGGVAHDFNNILMSITTQISLAKMKLTSAQEAEPHLIKAQKAVSNAADLTRQLLAYANKGSLHIKRVDLTEIVQETITMVEDVLDENIHIQQNYAPAPLFVEGDKSQIRQVILNIVMNAAESMQEQGGWIHISTYEQKLELPVDASPTTNRQVLSPGPYAVLSVRDSGPGMDEATQQRIFDPFFSTKKTGHGLGLSAALGLVNGHGGTIFVDSEPGVGALFTVWVPAATQSSNGCGNIQHRRNSNAAALPQH